SGRTSSSLRRRRTRRRRGRRRRRASWQRQTEGGSWARLVARDRARGPSRAVFLEDAYARDAVELGARFAPVNGERAGRAGNAERGGQAGRAVLADGHVVDDAAALRSPRHDVAIAAR